MGSDLGPFQMEPEPFNLKPKLRMGLLSTAKQIDEI